MRILFVYSRKGGVGKSTTAANLAVVAEAEGRRTALVDADEQGSVTSWGAFRDAPTPIVATASTMQLRDALAAARSDGIALTIVDMPAALGAGEVNVLDAADLVLVPARPSPFDLRATEATLLAVAGAKRPAAIVLTQVRARGRETDEMRAYFQATPWPVLTAMLGERIAFPLAIARGLGVTEYEDGAAAREVRALFSELWRTLDG